MSDRRRFRRHLGDAVAFGVLAAGLAGFIGIHELARHVQPQLGVFCLLAALACATQRLWLACGAWGLVAGLALYPVLPEYLPPSGHEALGCRLTVVTFNQLEEHPDTLGAARLLAGLRPDIIFAQKIYDTRGFRDALLASGFAGFHDFLSPENGQLIVSRFPLRQTISNRDGMSADAVIAGTTVWLRNMYAQRPIGEHGKPAIYHQYYARLAAEISAHPGPLILAGDGNASIFTGEIQNLRRRLKDAWDEAGFGLGATFPGPWRRLGFLGPWVRIDYVFHGDAFVATAARRISDATGAGHYPVWAELSFLGHGDVHGRCE